jgi:hypothetical protein
MDERHIALAQRGKTQPPPSWVIWELLCDPFRSDDRPWFDVRDGEQPPTILSSKKHQRVTWSSIWSDHPELTIEFQIEPRGPGSDVTWTLFGPEGCLDDDDIRRRRYRLNQLINGQLRDTFDQ